MGSAGWLLVTEESPCHVCGKSDWCSVSADGKKAICRRKDGGEGVRRTDKSGQDYWLYELNGHRELILSEDVSQQDGEVLADELVKVQTREREIKQEMKELLR